VLDLQSLGLLHRARASPAASPERSAIFKGFPTVFTSASARMVPRATISAVSFFFPPAFMGFLLYFGPVFRLLLAQVWVSLLGFGEGLFVFVGGFFCFFGLGFFGGFYYS
jgi:hypothetical protein